MDAPSSMGWPFPIYVSGCNWSFDPNIKPTCFNDFVWIGLILDIIFWYVISCIIIVAYHVNTKQVRIR